MISYGFVPFLKEILIRMNDLSSYFTFYFMKA